MTHRRRRANGPPTGAQLADAPAQPQEEEEVEEAQPTQIGTTEETTESPNTSRLKRPKQSGSQDAGPSNADERISLESTGERSRKRRRRSSPQSDEATGNDQEEIENPPENNPAEVEESPVHNNYDSPENETHIDDQSPIYIVVPNLNLSSVLALYSQFPSEDNLYTLFNTLFAIEFNLETFVEEDLKAVFNAFFVSVFDQALRLLFVVPLSVSNLASSAHLLLYYIQYCKSRLQIAGMEQNNYLFSARLEELIYAARQDQRKVLNDLEVLQSAVEDIEAMSGRTIIPEQASFYLNRILIFLSDYLFNG